MPVNQANWDIVNRCSYNSLLRIRMLSSLFGIAWVLTN